MACRFSFHINMGYGEAVFQSDNGSEHFVEYNCDNSFNAEISIKWNTDINAVVLVELYPWDNLREPFMTKTIVVRSNQKTATFQNVNYLPCICVINVIPHLETQSIQYSTVLKSASKESSPVKKKKVVEKKFQKLSADMLNLLLKGNLSDVIVSNGFTDFPAHKCLLSARSSVFAKMFQHLMKESRENRVTITDMSADVLKKLLSYIYTGIVCIEEGEMARNLYMAADKYDIKDLKNVCSVYLKDVNLDSVLDTLIFANLYGDKTLKASAMDFITKNFSQVKAQKSWGQLIEQNHKLVIEVLSFVVEKK